jgi:hypothetical protein
MIQKVILILDEIALLPTNPLQLRQDLPLEIWPQAQESLQIITSSKIRFMRSTGLEWTIQVNLETICERLSRAYQIFSRQIEFPIFCSS